MCTPTRASVPRCDGPAPAAVPSLYRSSQVDLPTYVQALIDLWQEGSMNTEKSLKSLFAYGPPSSVVCVRVCVRVFVCVFGCLCVCLRVSRQSIRVLLQ